MTNLNCLSPPQHWHKACGRCIHVRVMMLCAHTPWTGNPWWKANDTNACDNREFFRHDPTTLTKTLRRQFPCSHVGGTTSGQSTPSWSSEALQGVRVQQHRQSQIFAGDWLNWKLLWCCLIGSRNNATYIYLFVPVKYIPESKQQVKSFFTWHSARDHRNAGSVWNDSFCEQFKKTRKLTCLMSNWIFLSLDRPD